MKREQIVGLIIVLVLVGAVLVAKAHRHPKLSPAPAVVAAAQPLPEMVDLGAGTCAACRKMAPIIEKLQTELRGKAEIQFIDTDKDPNAADKYHVLAIPTQIFRDAHGKEVSRHSGFMDRTEILSRLQQAGVKIDRGGA